jgi:tetratricopeptide (TPR) repeat protein
MTMVATHCVRNICKPARVMSLVSAYSQRREQRLSIKLHGLLFTLIAFFLCTHPLPAQMMCHVQELQDQMPPDELPEPQKMTGIGNVHLQITATPEAQAWFDQGLNLLHDFWDYESARAFQQGIRVDPQCAMCYWGLYQAEAFYHSLAKDYAKEALDKAVALKDHVSEREQLYIEGTVTQNLDLWRKLVADYPADTEAHLMFATTLHGDQGIEALQAVLKADPNNSAANHLYIHAVEGTSHPEQGLHSADILASLAPNSGHMVHMPGHIFFRMGDYARAEQAFSQSTQVDERYMREQHVSPDDDWNYVHNLMYAIANLMEEGKFTRAVALSAKLSGAHGELESSLYTYLVRDAISRINPRLPIALRTANWKQTLHLLQSRTHDAGLPHLNFLALQLSRFARAMRAAKHNQLANAQTLCDKITADLDRASHEDNEVQPPPKRKLQVLPDALLSPIVQTLSVMSLELRASIAARQNRMHEAEQLFAEAQRHETALGYHEPPSYIRPVGETEGAVMLSIGNWSAARSAYQRALGERPHSGLALYGLALAAEKSGDATAAGKTYREFLTAWKDADPELPQLTHARKALSRPMADGLSHYSDSRSLATSVSWAHSSSRLPD